MVYVPSAGRVSGSMKSVLTDVTRASWDPSGLRNVTVGYPIELPPPNFTLTRCPAVPAKDTTAFCPGTVLGTEICGPPTVNAAVLSAGTVQAWTVSVPTEAPLGST